MNTRHAIAAALIAGTSLFGFAGAASAGGNPPGPCEYHPESMPEYCNPSGPGDPGDPGDPKPGGAPFDFTDVPRDEVESTRGELGVDRPATARLVALLLPGALLIGSTDDGEVQGREHILLARQVGVAT
jgi:hypothetical protein